MLIRAFWLPAGVALPAEVSNVILICHSPDIERSTFPSIVLGLIGVISAPISMAGMVAIAGILKLDVNVLDFNGVAAEVLKGKVKTTPAGTKPSFWGGNFDLDVAHFLQDNGL